jgi:hypothetical protein
LLQWIIQITLIIFQFIFIYRPVVPNAPMPWTLV